MSNNNLSALKQAYLALEKMEAKVKSLQNASREPIAIIGIGCRFPGGANNPETFWQFLQEGTDAVREVPADRWDINTYYDPDPTAPGKMLTRHGAFLDAIDQFDPNFFGIAPREAASMDPQQRLLLEVAWEALENAGQDPDKLSGSRTGVFLGIVNSDYRQLTLDVQGISNIDSYYSSGVAQSVASGRLSYVLGLQGPSISIDTACSSSLVAVHLACQSLRNKESNMALAGGVNLILTPELSIAFSKYQMLSADGRCKTFDARADGFGRGEGCGLIVLKRLSDAIVDGDHIHALILGSAVNQDGPSSGLTAPNGPAQESVIRDALGNAGLQPKDITFVEAHGTGTSLGDPIEVQALGSVFHMRDPNQPLLIGSVKTNFGHLEGAAGITGLIKAALSVQHQAIPAHLHFGEPSPFIPWADLPVQVPTELTRWPTDAPLNAGISAFGFSGTNAHIIVGAAPQSAKQIAKQQQPALLKLSTKSETTLKELARRFADHISTTSDVSLEDVCYSANVGRADLLQRFTMIAESKSQAIEKLYAFAASTSEEKIPGVVAGQIQSIDQPKIAFLFTGQGSQYPDMGKELYKAEPVFRKTVDQCAEILQPYLENSLLDILFADNEASTQINETGNAQPALFALEYALAELWRSWGIQPSLVLGHSVGEYVAACIAGVFSLEDGLKLIAARGRLMQSLPAGGQMAAVFTNQERVRRVLEPYKFEVNIAALNGPNNIVISGIGSAVQSAINDFAAEGIKTRSLVVSHAFHSPAMESILSGFETVAAEVNYSAPKIKLVSNLTGQLAMGNIVARPAYWREHIRRTVQFEAGMKTTQAQGANIYLEIGPDPVLLGMGQNCVTESSRKSLWLPSLRKNRDDWQTMLQSLGEMYVYGTNIDWAGFERHKDDKRRIPLPTSPFDRKRYWVSEKPYQKTVQSKPEKGIHPLLGRQLRSPLKETQFESQISVGSLSFLNDHRLYGSSILPGTAYMEAGLAVSSLLFHQRHHLIKDLVIREPLIASDDSKHTLQVIVTAPQNGAATFNIYSSRGTEANDTDWTLYASGIISTETINESITDSDSLEIIQQRCIEEMAGDAHYRSLRDLGLEFGPSLRGVQHIWRKSVGGEALGQISLPAALSVETASYVVHPALLDACLQIVAAALPFQDHTDIYMPLGLDSIKVYGQIGNQLWSHATVEIDKSIGGQETFSASVRLLDDSGQVLADLAGVHLKRASKAALIRLASQTQKFNDWLYQVKWQPSPLETNRASDHFAAPSEIASHLQPSISTFAQQAGMAEFQELSPQLNEFSSQLILYALQKLGWDSHLDSRFVTNDLIHELGIKDSYCELLERFLDILSEDGFLENRGTHWIIQREIEKNDFQSLEQRGSTLLKRYPMFEAEITLLTRCGLQLAEILTGKTDPLELLFPGGDLTTPEKLYGESPLSKAYNTLAQSALVKALDQFPGEKPLHILEIGAGTGGTTSYLVPQLRTRQVEYVFTDMSTAFLSRARKKFQDSPFVNYQLLDIERSPENQGFEPHRYDLIVAANVIHATADLRNTLRNVQKLLAPDGLLMMLEVTSFVRWIDLTFGLTDGWWKFTDKDIRSSYPLVNQQTWQRLLTEIGFTQTSSLPSSADSGLDQAMILARNASVVQTSETQRNWLIFTDASGLGKQLAASLRQQGDRCVLVSPGNYFEKHSSDQFFIDVALPQDFQRLLSEAIEASLHWHGIVHLWNLDSPATEMMDTNTFNTAQQMNTGSTLYLIQAIAKLTQPIYPRLWLVTRGAIPVRGVSTLSLAQTPASGFGKAIALEHPELHCTYIDLDTGSDNQVQQLCAEILSSSREDQVAFSNGQRHVARLSKYIPAETPSNTQNRPVHLTITKRGLLENLVLEPATRRSPGPNEVEIHVRATGLNFRDVLNALDMYAGNPGPLGGECSGEIVAVGKDVTDFKIGDAVMGIVADSFQSHVIAPANMIAQKPAHLSFEEAATMLIPYMTAYFTMQHLGKISAGEKVLIHAAAGGVGLAAVKLALHAGAEIFATAGSSEKRAFLKNLGVHHVFNSRSLDFADEIMHITRGEGVDLVLNSLANEFCTTSLSALGQNGRFLEIGKRGILNATEVKNLRPDVSYSVVDWSETFHEEPALMQNLLSELVRKIEDKTFTPLPLRRFTLDHVVDAFRYMTNAKHIGKIVVTQESDFASRSKDFSPHADASYLITGGLGGLGLLIAKWLVEKGARHLILMGRGTPDPAAQQAIQEMQQQGAEVFVEQADVSVAEQVTEVFKTIELQMPPLRGVIHAAGVLSDGMLINQAWSSFSKVFAPKVAGTWHLHELTKHRSLDFFVMFSSVASLVGSRGQANHAAANTFMDLLAYHRQAQGLPALSINWGAWSQTGAAVEHGVTERILQQGISTFSPEEGLQVLEYLLNQSAPQVGVAPIHWSTFMKQYRPGTEPPFFAEMLRGMQAEVKPKESHEEKRADLSVRLQEAPANKRQSLLILYIQSQVGKVLGLESGQKVNEHIPLSEMGLDSLMAVEVRNILGSELNLKRALPATLVFDYPTVAAIADYIMTEMDLIPTDVKQEQSTTKSNKDISSEGSVDNLLGAIEGLSDEEVDRMLAEQMKEGKRNNE